MKKLLTVFWVLFFTITSAFGIDNFSRMSNAEEKVDIHIECKSNECIDMKNELEFLDASVEKRRLKIKRIESAILNYDGPDVFLWGALCVSFVNPAMSILMLGGAAVNVTNAYLVRPARCTWHQKKLIDLQKTRTRVQEKFKQEC